MSKIRDRLRLLPPVLIGGFALGAQTLLFREHLLAYGGSEIGIGVFLAGWMLWIALGAVLGRRRGFPIVAGVYPAGLLLSVLLTWSLRDLAGLEATRPFGLDSLVPLSLLASAPAGLLTGWVFPAAAAWLGRQGEQRPGEATVQIYGAEAFGAFLGGLLLTLALEAGLQTTGALAGLVLVYSLPLVGWGLGRRSERWRVVPGGVLMILVGVGVQLGSGGVQELRTRSMPIPPGAEVRASLDTPYGNWTVADLQGQTVVYGNGRLRSWIPDEPAASRVAAILLAQAPAARRVALLGFGGETLACRFLEAGAERVMIADLDPGYLKALQPSLSDELSSCLADPRLTIRFADPGQALQEEWDLLVLRASDPDTAAGARFLTREFFTALRGRLADGGVVALTITVTENHLAGPALEYARAVYHTLSQVFERVIFSPGEAMLFLAGGEELSEDGAVLVRRLKERGQGELRYPPEALPDAFDSGRIAKLWFLLKDGAERLITADRPGVFLLRSLLQGQAEDSSLAAWLGARGHMLPWLLLVLFVAIALAAGREIHRRGRHASSLSSRLLLAAAGGAAMTWQVALMLAWQLRFGSLYSSYGLLSALFMLGLFGGYLLTRRPRWILRTWRVGAAGFLLALVGMGLLAVLALPGGTPALLLLPLACLVLGVAAGLVPPLAAGELAAAGFDEGATAAWVQGADHGGALLAAPTAGVVLLPLVGMQLTVALWLLPLVLGASLCLFESRLRSRGGRSPRPLLDGLRGLWLVVLVLAAAVSISVALEPEPPPTSAPPLLLPSNPAPTPETQPAGPVTVDQPFPHVLVYGEDGRLERIRLSSAAVGPEVLGYEGPLAVKLELDPDGRILSAEMDFHVETPDYVAELERWVASLAGRRAAELRLGKGPGRVDVITGATVTSRAVLKAARRAGRAAEQLLGREPPPEPEGSEKTEVRSGPQQHRRSNDQRPYQRPLPPDLLEQVRSGALSEKEALHWIPVE